MQGVCDDGDVIECTNDPKLKYGLELGSVAYADYADSKCETLYLASFYPYGCDGDGFKEFCEGDGTFIVMWTALLQLSSQFHANSTQRG